MAITAPDLTRQAPRSARVRLGGYVLLPRVLDKCRAVIIGKQGEYKFNCPLDQRFFEFTGIDAAKFKAQVVKGKGDGEMLEWVGKNSKTKPSPVEIEAWSLWMDNRGPTDIESRAYFNDLASKVAPKREDIASWADLLDVDDYASFGGQV